MSSTKQRNRQVLDKSSKFAKDFDNKTKHIEDDSSVDDRFEPKKPVKSLFEQFVDLDLRVSMMNSSA